MNEVVTIEQIRSQFESEWVLVENPKTDKNLNVISGRALCHNKDRDEVYRQAVALCPRRSAAIYTGEIPEETAVIL